MTDQYTPNIPEHEREDFDRWLAARDAEKRAEWEAEQAATKWEYQPGWIGADGRARVSAGHIAEEYVGQFMAEGGEVVRRQVGAFEAVTRDMLPVPVSTEPESEKS